MGDLWKRFRARFADKIVEAFGAAAFLLATVVVRWFWGSELIDPFLLIAAICLATAGLLVYRGNKKPWISIVSPLPDAPVDFEHDVHVSVNPPGLRVVVFVRSGPKENLRWYRQASPSSIGTRELKVKCKFGNSATEGYGNEHRIKAICAPDDRLERVMVELPKGKGVTASDEIRITRK